MQESSLLIYDGDQMREGRRTFIVERYLDFSPALRGFDLFFFFFFFFWWQDLILVSMPANVLRVPYQSICLERSRAECSYPILHNLPIYIRSCLQT